MKLRLGSGVSTGASRANGAIQRGKGDHVRVLARGLHTTQES